MLGDEDKIAVCRGPLPVSGSVEARSGGCRFGEESLDSRMEVRERRERDQRGRVDGGGVGVAREEVDRRVISESWPWCQAPM